MWRKIGISAVRTEVQLRFSFDMREAHTPGANQKRSVAFLRTWKASDPDASYDTYQKYEML